MKKFYFPLILLLTIALSGFSKNITAYLSYSTFKLPNGSPYVETYLTIMGNSIEFTKNNNGKLQGTIDIIMEFKSGNEIKAQSHYELNSPEALDTLTALRTNFLDQQRFILPNGSYTLELTIKDKVASGVSYKNSFPVSIDFNESTVNISDIQLVESYSRNEKGSALTKSGYDLVPYTSELFPKNMDKIKFYAEVYNASKALGSDGRYMISTYMESYDNKNVLENYSIHSREKASAVTPVLREFNIDKLPSGNYNLVVEARSATNELLSVKKIFFQRSNPIKNVISADSASLNNLILTNTFAERITNSDTLKEYLKSIYPIAKGVEFSVAMNSVKSDDIKQMQRYLYYFWSTQNEKNPEKAFLDYNEKVKIVQNAYGTQTFRGYMTDRGRVYLRYGAPSHIVKRDFEANGYPYEIWQYNQLDNRTNRKFVFALHNLATNNYRLLHSDYPGEFYNPRWELDLHRDRPVKPSVDSEKPYDRQFNKDVDDYNDMK